MTRFLPEKLLPSLFAALTALLVFVAADLWLRPAQAQFFGDRFSPFDFRGPQFGVPRNPEPRGPPPDYSKAPPPRKLDAEPQTNVVVLGDSLADWLAHGLELAFAESPEIGVVRKHKAGSGLLRYEARSEQPDWPQAARDLLAAEKPGVVVMMVGLHDRQALRERVPVRPAATPPAAPGRPAATQTAPAPAAATAGQAQLSPTTSPATSSQEAQPNQSEAAVQPNPNEDSTDSPPASPEPAANPGPDEKATPVTIRSHEFRSERWAELYVERVDHMIATLKSKGVPVIWVGLPSIRGARSTADAVYLNEIYRSRAERAGIIFVDIWDGFADLNGRYVLQGPDFEGQIRRLRSPDGVHFTRAGARTLAHFVEREVRRVLATRSAPIEISVPQEPTPQTPDIRPGAPIPRPLAGPVIPLATSETTSDDLLGDATIGQAATSAAASRVLIKGDALPAPAGRADDFAWPRRVVAPVGTDPVATTTTAPATPAIAQPPRPASSPVAAASSSDSPSRTPGNAARAPANQSQATAPRPPASVPRPRRQAPSPSPFSSPFFR